MVDRDRPSLWWSIALYYAILVLVAFAIVASSPADGTLGDAISTAAGMPLLMFLLFFTGLSVSNVWIASVIVIAVLVGLLEAFVRLRGKWRICLLHASRPSHGRRALDEVSPRAKSDDLFDCVLLCAFRRRDALAASFR